MKRLPALVLVALIVPCTAHAQTAQPTQPPKPGPEVQQMAQWLGAWQCAYESRTTQAKGEMSMTCDWAAGGFFLVCKGATGSRMFTIVLGYHPDEQAYWWFRYQSNGSADFARGWVNGNTWTSLPIRIR